MSIRTGTCRSRWISRQHLETVDPRQHQVEDDQVGPEASAELDSCVAVAGDLDLEAFRAQPRCHRCGDRRLVLNHSYPPRMHGSSVRDACCEGVRITCRSRARLPLYTGRHGPHPLCPEPDRLAPPRERPVGRRQPAAGRLVPAPDRRHRPRARGRGRRRGDPRRPRMARDRLERGPVRQSERADRHREAARGGGEPDEDGSVRFGRTTLLRPDG